MIETAQAHADAAEAERRHWHQRVAARLRFRAILMTAFSFILGVIPLVIASGAGARSRVSLGTAVFGGMLASTALGIFFIPFVLRDPEPGGSEVGTRRPPAATCPRSSGHRG